MEAMNVEAAKKRIDTMKELLDERQLRIYLAAEAESIGWGGGTKISQIAGVDKDTLTAGKKDLESVRNSPKEKQSVFRHKGVHSDEQQRVRKPGGGRKSIRETQPGIVEALLKLVDNSTYGNPENPLQWTVKSCRVLADELIKEGYQVSHAKVSDLLAEEGFTLQENRKLKQVGESHVDRDAQFQHINDTVKAYIAENLPVISVDCKKKENLGEFKNDGSEYAKSGSPIVVKDHDFLDKEYGKAVPYGTYDIAYNEGFVNVGVSSDTAQFAVNSIRCWWNEMGRDRYPEAKHLYITADGGGSNGSRCRLWKLELQKLCNETGLSIEVSHFPPGTSKWNKIEHRMFSWITKNWRGKPLVTLQVVVNLIAATKTNKGLKIMSQADLADYSTKIKVSDAEMESINLVKNEFHGDWNYCIFPQASYAHK